MGEPTWIAELLAEVRRPRLPVTVVCVAFVLLLAAAHGRADSDVVVWATKYRPWILVAALLSSTLLGYDAIHAVVRRASRERYLLWAMKSLGTAEREQLAHWMQNGITAGQLDRETGTGESLVRRGIMVPGERLEYGTVYHLEPWAVSYLRKHPETLQDPPADADHGERAGPGPGRVGSTWVGDDPEPLHLARDLGFARDPHRRFHE